MFAYQDTNPFCEKIVKTSMQDTKRKQWFREIYFFLFAKEKVSIM